MNEPQNRDVSERTDRPGKTRTWWHPLLARLLDHFLATAYAVRDEVLVGKLPLRVDILLIRRETGELSETSRRDLSVLVPLLNRFTLIEHARGVHRVSGGPFTTWLIETDVMAGSGQPILSLVSRVFLDEHERIIGELTRTGHAGLLHYPRSLPAA